MAAGQLSSPGVPPHGPRRGDPGTPFLARQESRPAAILRSAPARAECVVDRLRPGDRHRDPMSGSQRPTLARRLPLAVKGRRRVMISTEDAKKSAHIEVDAIYVSI